MADFFEDPQFPERPQHPDFHRLMDAVNYLDGESSEGNRPAHEVAAELIDVDSLDYMAMQRAKMMSRLTGVPVHVLASIWMDSFCAGVKFQQAGGHRPS